MVRFLTVFLPLASGLGNAATFYASPGGGGNGSSTASPWTLATALSSAGANDTIMLMDGDYPDVGGYDVVTSGQTIKAINKWKAVLRNSSYHGIYSTADNVTIDGLQVTNATVDGIKMAGNNCTARNCWVVHTGTQGISCHNYDGVVIENNLIENGGWNPTSGYTPDFCHGIYAGSARAVIRNNVVRHNQGYGIQLYPGDNYVVSGCRVYNNLIYDNALYQGIQGGIVVYTDDATNAIGTNYIYGNTVIDNNGSANGCIRAVFGTTFVTNNILMGGSKPISSGTGNTCWNGYNLSSTSISPGGTGNIVNSSAGFVNAGNGLYWLTSGSAARNQASTAVLDLVNFFGSAQSSVTDIGFNQYSATYAADSRTLDPSPSTGADYWQLLSAGVIAPPENLHVVSVGP